MTDEEKLFHTEEQILKNGLDVLEGIQKNNPLINDFKKLLDSYRKTLKQSKRLIKISDRQQQKLNTALSDARKAREALWGEMALAKKIQTILLPKTPQIAGYEVSVYMEPADEVGGDYYDIINTDTKDWIVIGDVSGHGISAGLVMMMVQTAIHTILNRTPSISPSELVAWLNKTIWENLQLIDNDKYMSIDIFSINENGVFKFAGLHQDILVYRQNRGEVELIPSNGMWIGCLENITGMLKDGTFTLAIGDTMLLYTDGLTEAWDMDDTMLSIDRLKSLFTGIATLPTEDIKHCIIKYLKHYQKHDDVTFVILKRLE